MKIKDIPKAIGDIDTNDIGKGVKSTASKTLVTAEVVGGNLLKGVLAILTYGFWLLIIVIIVGWLIQ